MYAAAPEGDGKPTVARSLIGRLRAEKQIKISGQVVSEYINVWFKKDLAAYGSQLVADLELFRLCLDEHSILNVVAHALEIHGRYSLSWFDSQMIASAKLSGCTVIYSEDMQHGAVYDGVTVVNPFVD